MRPTAYAVDWVLIVITAVPMYRPLPSSYGVDGVVDVIDRLTCEQDDMPLVTPDTATRRSPSA
ncbi:hypothetical protein [Streptomyces virginiae]|uniref:hypothetical protein n=1 Tax=Streptomyces virginiae TaxID=1961 RepID=UPI00325066B5